MVLVNKASGRQRHHGLSTHRPVTGGGGVADIDVDKVRTALNEEPYTPEPDKELPDWTGPDRSAEDSANPGAPELNDEQLKETEDKAFEQIRQSRVLDVDAVLPHIPGYNEAPPLTRDRAYRRTARDITRKLLDRLLAEPKKTGKVIIVSGGAGSGKSDVASKLPTDADLLIEIPLSAPEQIHALRDQVAASGREINILHIHRDFSSSFENVIYRYLNNKSQGSSKTTDLSTAISNYLETADTLSKIEKVSFRILDNNRSREERRPISLENLTKSLNTQIHETAGDTGKPGRSGSMAGRNSGKGHPRPERRSGDTEAKGPNPGNSRGAGPAARLEAIGLEIIKGFRTSGRLTNAEAAAFAGGVGKVKVQFTEADGTLPDRGVSAGEIGTARKRFEDLSRVPGSETETEPDRIGSGDLGKWAAETRRLIDADWWNNTVKSWEQIPSDESHTAYRDDVSHRVLRIPKSPETGVSGISTDYLKSIQLHNLIFKDDIRIEGVVELPDGSGGGSVNTLVTSQAYTEGSRPTQERINNWLNSLGFVSEGNNVFSSADYGVQVTDAVPGNFMVTSTGNLVPLHLTLRSDIPIDELLELLEP